MKRPTTIVKDINRLFGTDAPDEKYPVAFIRKGEKHACVTSEVPTKRIEKYGDEVFEFTAPACDYYDYYRDTRGVDPILIEYLDKNGLAFEWEDPVCIMIIEKY